MQIETISIRNFKSIRELTNFSLGKINVLIGANGVGKTNFISFLKLLKQVANKNLQYYTAEQAGANNILHFGRKVSPFIGGRINFDNGNAYEFELAPNNEDSFFFSRETASYHSSAWNNQALHQTGYPESRLDDLIKIYKQQKGYEGVPGYVKAALADFEIYHFHDTSKNAPVKQTSDINDNRTLKNDGSNLAAFLYYLQEIKPVFLRKIEGTVRQNAPFFESFILEPSKLNSDKIRLEWKEKGNNDYFNAHQLSDGTIRMIALTTLLLQPNPPATIIIDEPELGLHPAAIHLLASLIRKASVNSQIIISTQSVTLVNQFAAEDLIIVEREDNQSTFKRLDVHGVSAWLDDYSLGEAWEKNILGGRP